jgi:hypothetical protein
MPVTEGYRREPYMTTAKLPIHHGREVHFHPEPGAEGSRAVPLYPTEDEIKDHERSWKGLGPLPEIPHIASPLEGLERRSQLLTPISEQDSLEDPRLQQLRENVPHFPQVHHWLRSMSPSAENNPPSVGPSQGKSCPEACPKPDKKLKKPHKPARNLRGKIPKLGSKKKTETGKATKRNPDTLVTPTIRATEPPVASASSGGPVAGPAEVRRTPGHNLTANIVVARPPESQRQHSLKADIFVSSPSESRHPHSIQDDAVISNASRFQRQHSLQADPCVTTSDPSPAPHVLEADEVVQFLPLTGREHSLGVDRRLSAGETPVRQHSLASDAVITLEKDPEFSVSDAESQGHDIQQDPEVPVSLATVQPHDLESDTRVPTPKLLQPREHSLSRDIRVLTPTSKGRLCHGIHLDERVPTPELVRLNMEHDIL